MTYIIDMPIVSYFNLNQIYIINTALFIGTFLIVIVWMHVHLHASVMNDVGATCNDPIAKFFDKRLAERCHVNTIMRDTNWVDKNLDNIVKTLSAREDRVNERALGMYELYNSRNVRDAAAFAKKIEDKQIAMNELQTVVTNIKTGAQENEKSVIKLLDDYQVIAAENIGKLRMLASGIVDKLKRNIYTKNYKKKRKNYVGAYNKIGAYFKKIGSAEELDEIPAEAKNGRV